MTALSHITCWLFHARERELLFPGVLPWGLDAVVFCWRCDRFRGRPVKTLQSQLHGAR